MDVQPSLKKEMAEAHKKKSVPGEDTEKKCGAEEQTVEGSPEPIDEANEEAEYKLLPIPRPSNPRRSPSPYKPGPRPLTDHEGTLALQHDNIDTLILYVQSLRGSSPQTGIENSSTAAEQQQAESPSDKDLDPHDEEDHKAERNEQNERDGMEWHDAGRDCSPFDRHADAWESGK